jgi:hypothetical protein
VGLGELFEKGGAVLMTFKADTSDLKAKMKDLQGEQKILAENALKQGEAQNQALRKWADALTIVKNGFGLLSNGLDTLGSLWKEYDRLVLSAARARADELNDLNEFVAKSAEGRADRVVAAGSREVEFAKTAAQRTKEMFLEANPYSGLSAAQIRGEQERIWGEQEDRERRDGVARWKKWTDDQKKAEEKAEREREARRKQEIANAKRFAEEQRKWVIGLGLNPNTVYPAGGDTVDRFNGPSKARAQQWEKGLNLGADYATENVDSQAMKLGGQLSEIDEKFRGQKQRVLESIFGKPEEFDLYTEKMQGLSDAVGIFSSAATSGFSAWVDGSKTAGEAIKQFSIDFLKGVALNMWSKALEHGAAAVGSLAMHDPIGAADHGRAAALYAAGAIAVGGAARMAGKSAGSSSGASSATPRVGRSGSSSGNDREDVINIYMGDTLAPDNPRRQRQDIARAIRNAHRELQQGREGTFE